MNLSNINTWNDFYRFADIQYQRAKSLSYICHNENETIERRKKAFKLFIQMEMRVNNLKAYCAEKGQLRKKRNDDRFDIVGGVNFKGK